MINSKYGISIRDMLKEHDKEKEEKKEENKMRKMLEFLAMADDYDITDVGGGTFTVDTLTGCLRATIDTKRNVTTYAVTGCYNSGDDSREFDIDALLKLKKFCELLSEDK